MLSVVLLMTQWFAKFNYVTYIVLKSLKNRWHRGEVSEEKTKKKKGMIITNNNELFYMNDDHI